jgi:D-glycero-D-manno-heptose 1,7-bisphosphate phosphatase
MNKAIFLDRDGVINPLVYYEEQEFVDSPFTVTQFKLLPAVAEALNLARQAGYLAVLVSNQPGIAKGHMTISSFQAIKLKMKNDLAAQCAALDGEYYCLHHPQAAIAEYKQVCDCRKPAPGLFLRAAREMNIDLSRSWMVGDNLSDVKAGKSAACRTVLLGKMKCETCHLMDEQNARPDVISPDLLAAVKHIIGHSSKVPD